MMFLPDVSGFAFDTLRGVASSAGVPLYNGHDGIDPAVISPGAWARVAERLRRVKLLLDHDPERPLGVADLDVDGRGWLLATCYFADTAEARDVVTLARKGVGGRSVSFKPSRLHRDTHDGQPVTVVDDLDLFEISFVATPRDPNARFGLEDEPDDFVPIAAGLPFGGGLWAATGAASTASFTHAALASKDAYRASAISSASGRRSDDGRAPARASRPAFGARDPDDVEAPR